MADDVELVVVTMAFEARGTEADDALRRHLAKYVVLARDERGCRNVDLVASATHPHRYLVVEKWESDEHRRAHFDGDPLVELARSCEGLLARPPAWSHVAPIAGRRIGPPVSIARWSHASSGASRHAGGAALAPPASWSSALRHQDRSAGRAAAFQVTGGAPEAARYLGVQP